MTTELWCVVCGDPFDTDPTVGADKETPLCSAECDEEHERALQFDSDYSL